MDSFGVRFSETKYIKIVIDFESGENVVTLVTEVDGTPLTETGAIVWDKSFEDGKGLG